MKTMSNISDSKDKMKADNIISLFSQLSLLSMTEVIRELEKIRNENLGNDDKRELEIKL
jgi:hypothetical protein